MTPDLLELKDSIITGLWVYLEKYFVDQAALAKMAEAYANLGVGNLPDEEFGPLKEFVELYNNPQLLAGLEGWKQYIDKIKFASSQEELLGLVKGTTKIVEQVNLLKKRRPLVIK